MASARSSASAIASFAASSAADGLTAASGEELQALNHPGFLAYRSQGQVIRGTIDLAPQVVAVAVTGSEATLSDCYASHILLHSRATGQPEGSGPPQRTLVTARMLNEGGVWKVAGIRHEGEGCAPAR